MAAVTPYTQEEITSALTALVAWAGNASAARRYLKSIGKRAPDSGRLTGWARTQHWEEYERIRDQYAEKVEATVASDLRDAARAAIEVERLAIEKARDRLEAGLDEDPGKTAANLARVAQSSTDKLLSLTGRPTQITETRNVSELVRSLAARGVLQLAEAEAEVEDET